MTGLGDPVLVGLGFAFVFAALGAAEALRRGAGMAEEGTRKLVHVAVGHWIILAVWIESVAWAAVAPVAFIALNYLSYRRGTFGAMERTDRAGGLGTVYYSVALAVLVAWFWRAGHERWPAVAGILAMAWGDGLAAIVGQRWGARTYRLTGGHKTVEGSAAMFAAALVVVWIAATEASAGLGVARAGIVAGIATLLEAASPAGTDNLTVPLGTAVLLAAVA